jgi:predicted ribosome quality control (RQC) complex YloA/Tae2 family protein
MIINSTLVFCQVPELEEAFKGNKIVQIFQSPDKKELILVTRSRKKEASLFFCAHAENYRIEILDEGEWETKKPNYQKTNLFSYAMGGHIQEIRQVDFDRVIKISCLRKSQLGRSIEFDLIFELTGRNSNLILVRKDGLIIDCLRKIDSTRNRFRQVLPGERYIPPPPPLAGKNPFQVQEEKFVGLLRSRDLPVSKLLISHFIGVNQLLAEKIIFETNIPIQVKTTDLSEENIEHLWKNFTRTFQQIAEHKLTFQIVINQRRKPEGISCVDLPFLKDDQKISCESLNSAIKEFFSQKLEGQEKETELKRLFEVSLKAQKRLKIKKEKVEVDLNQAEKFEQYKKFGDLLVMNKDSIRKGEESVTLLDIFDPQQSLVEIPLSAERSPIQNAQAYFKKYKKAKDALVMMKKRQAETQKEIVKVEKILEKLEGETKELDLEEIEEELISLGFLKEKKIPEKRKGGKKEFSPRRFVTKDGSEILIGRNNKENDYLTFKFAHPGDLWFHAQDVPGSHVVLRRKEKKKEPLHSDIKEAAQVAAYFSKARGARKVPVIYTFAKYVRKPKKGKPGLALVEREKTILVEPKLTEK